MSKDFDRLFEEIVRSPEERRLAELVRTDAPVISAFVIGSTAVGFWHIVRTVAAVSRHPSQPVRSVLSLMVIADSARVAWAMGKNRGLELRETAEQRRERMSTQRPLTPWRLSGVAVAGLESALAASARRGVFGSVLVGLASAGLNLAVLLTGRSLFPRMRALSEANETVKAARREGRLARKGL